ETTANSFLTVHLLGVKADTLLQSLELLEHHCRENRRQQSKKRSRKHERRKTRKRTLAPSQLFFVLLCFRVFVILFSPLCLNWLRPFRGLRRGLRGGRGTWEPSCSPGRSRADRDAAPSANRIRGRFR